MNRSGGAWHTQTLNDNVDARYIEISVLTGQGGFAAISEIQPIRVTKIVLEECDHASTKVVRENNIDPTCTEAGSYDLVTRCAECDKELERETVTVPAAGHT